MLHVEGGDYRTVWVLAHEWAACPITDPTGELPIAVKQNLSRLSVGILNRSLKSQTKNFALFIDDSLIDQIINIRHIWRLYKCVRGRYYDGNYFSKLYIRRPNFLKWCEQELVPKPEFWKSPLETIVYNKRPKNEIEDKAVCRAIASVYWDIDPEIHPKHMVNSKAIRKYGNGDLYLDEKTVKSWIADLDPLGDTRKTGRPKDVIYKINLETGDLT